MAPPFQINSCQNSSYLNTALVAEDFPGRGPFPWNSPHFYAFLRRLVSSGPHFRDDDLYWDTRRRLEKEATAVVRFSKAIETFNEILGEFFKAPTVSPSPDNEVAVAAFFGFLLQTLNEVSDCCSDMDLKVREQLKILHEDLTFVFVFLMRTSLDGVEKVLPEINDAAEQGGGLLYSLFYSTEWTAENECKVFDDLHQRMKLVNATIRTQISKLPPAAVESQSDVVSISPFVLHFLLQDLDDLLPLFLIPPHVKDQIWILCQELKLLRSSIRNVETLGLQQKLVLKLRKLTYMLLTNLTIEECPSLTETIKLVMEELIMVNNTESAVEPDPTRTKYTLEEYQDHDDIVDFKEKILEEIVGEPDSLQIVSIIGKPGLGKTFLARKLYNYSNVVERFDRQAWCVVSQTYTQRSLLIRILKSVSDLEGEEMSTMEDERLGEELYISLKGRRYLIVLDDVWGVKAWDDLRKYFPDDSNGSKILFTSRGIALEASGNTTIHALPILSEDQCWELLKKMVFQKRYCPPELVDVGKRIAAGCRGLPLSVVVTGAVLGRMEKKASLWEEVSGSMTEDQLNILELGYKHLPEHLKLCFLYFAAFPRATEIPVRRLISHWMAQGFVVVNELEKSLEEIGQEYLMELIDRSLVLVAKMNFDGGFKACAIHDLLHELCFRIAEKDNFLQQEFASSSSSNSASRRFEFGLNARSLVDFNPNQSFIALKSLKLVRVLQMSENSDLNGICLLPDLRYLEVENLPASIGCLVQLQVLVVRKGGTISEVLLNMPNLQHVHFQSRTKFTYSLYLLTSKNKTFQDNNIQSISILRINNGRHIILRNFPNLRRLKCSFIASRASPRNRCSYPVLDFLTKLESLHISLEGEVKLFSGVLSFPLNLKKLTLSGFELSQREASVIGGLPKLEVLKLVKVSMEKGKWNGNEEEFKQLRLLKLDDVRILEWNASGEHFPKLVQLVVRNCAILEGIPASIGGIATLRLIEVEFCGETVAESAIRIRDEQREIGNDELKIIVSR